MEDFPTFLSRLRERYDITELGFMPRTNEVELFSSEVRLWNEIAMVLHRCERTDVRTRIMSLPEIPESYINEADNNILKKLYAILTVVVSSYVWSDPNDPPKILPSLLSVPLSNVSRRLGIQPILTHTSIDLLNWELKETDGGLELDNLRCLYLMTGTPSEEWFYLIMVAIEAVGGKIIEDIMRYDYLKREDFWDIEAITATLGDIAENIEKINRILDRIHEKCDPSVFWTVLRPYLSGWVNDRFQGLVYEGVSETPMMLTGGSAAQSSLFATIDAAFGVEHADEYFERIQSYMLRPHREFIRYIRENVQIKDFVSRVDNPELTKRFDEVIDRITSFRKKHYGIVYRYVISNAAKTDDGEPDASNADDGVNRGKGTGGTNLKSFLITSIKDTRNTRTV